jgi:hypothetical protein
VDPPATYVPTYTPVSEAEFISYDSSYNNETGVYVSPDVVEVDWSLPSEQVEVTKDVYNTLPYALRGDVSFNSTTKAFTYYKWIRSYHKYTPTYTYWKDSNQYVIENLAAGVYYVQFGGQVNVVVVKEGKTTTANFKDELKNPIFPVFNTEVTGTKAAGNTLTAKTRVRTPDFGEGSTDYSYYWTDGAKILSKKDAYKLSTTTAKKNLWVLPVATFKKYSEVADTWLSAPGNQYGAVGFDVQLTGTIKSGKKVKATIVNNQVSGAKYKYQWLRDGKAISGATKATYKLTKADKGKKISVKVTGTKDGYTTKTVKSKATKVL